MVGHCMSCGKKDTVFPRKTVSLLYVVTTCEECCQGFSVNNFVSYDEFNKRISLCSSPMKKEECSVEKSGAKHQANLKGVS